MGLRSEEVSERDLVPKRGGPVWDVQEKQIKRPPEDGSPHKREIIAK